MRIFLSYSLKKINMRKMTGWKKGGFLQSGVSAVQVSLAHFSVETRVFF